MATAPTNYDKITKYYRFINFRLIVTKSDQGEASPPPPSCPLAIPLLLFILNPPFVPSRDQTLTPFVKYLFLLGSFHT